MARIKSEYLKQNASDSVLMLLKYYIYYFQYFLFVKTCRQTEVCDQIKRRLVVITHNRSLYCGPKPEPDCPCIT